ncbi:mu-type opioid receptor-like [Amphiprion ocellaris]|uniref:mu-type opioid receptor-like n=1 Tax=Amphiprion ocellaris TaxID=80972 RepID=UPI00241180DD|nr:mu-type opioid receptor-like [Amphiprion ocellaris]
MCVNSSSSSNDSLLHPNPSSNIHFSFDMECFISRPGSFIFTSYMITSILLLLPLCIFIMYHGLQQWRLNHSTSSAATMSHSDSFTYNMVTMEMIGVFGSVLCCCGIYSDHFNIIIVAYSLMSFSWSGEIYFHVLTCVERYLAVVHPITYLSLRTERGIRIRNISISCVWMLSFAGTVLLMEENVLFIVYFCILTTSLTVVCFCSVSVLRVLIGPGPGEQGGGRKRVDQSKLRAFYTILVILVVLVFRFTWNLVWGVIYVLGRAECVLMTTGFWLNLPSTLVLPLLFLHRAGKLVCWKNKI